MLKSNSPATPMGSLQVLGNSDSPLMISSSPSALLQQLGTQLKEFAFAPQETSEWTWQSPTTPTRFHHSHARTYSGINTTVTGCPSLGQWTMEIKDQDKEDAAETTAKKFRSFGLEVSTWPCCHSEEEQPPNSQCYNQEKGHHKGNTWRRKNARVQLTLFEWFLVFRDCNRNLWKSCFTCWPGKGCLSRYLLLF